MSRQTSVQLSEATQRQVTALKEAGFGKFTAIVRTAIEELERGFRGQRPQPTTMGAET